MLARNTRLRDYVIEGKLGRGGFGAVYRARHRKLGTRHAVKVLQGAGASREFRRRFLAEGRIQAMLRHPNIVRVTDLLDAKGHPALVMDLIEGEDLAGYLARQAGPLPSGRVMDIFLQILRATGHAHAHGIIHRDLKPQNVLLEPGAGGRLQAYVSDFGIAKVLLPEDGEPLTRAGIAFGTPGYMSPEQLQGARDVTRRSDIFSLGVILYELATGATPFPDDTLSRVLRGDYAPPRLHVPDLDPALEAAIERALAPRPADRFASCMAFARFLREGVGKSQAEGARAPRLTVTCPVNRETARVRRAGGASACGLCRMPVEVSGDAAVHAPVLGYTCPTSGEEEFVPREPGLFWCRGCGDALRVREKRGVWKVLHALPLDVQRPRGRARMLAYVCPQRASDVLVPGEGSGAFRCAGCRREAVLEVEGRALRLLHPLRLTGTS